MTVHSTVEVLKAERDAAVLFATDTDPEPEPEYETPADSDVRRGGVGEASPAVCARRRSGACRSAVGCVRAPMTSGSTPPTRRSR